MTEHSATESCRALLACLEDEEAALESVLFKLKEQHLVLCSGEHRWLARTSAEVAAAMTGLRDTSRRREAIAAGVHAALGLGAGAGLGDVADRVTDEVTCQLLYQRRRSLRDVLDQVRRCARQNSELLARGLAATSDALALLGATPTYDAAGTATTTLGRWSERLDTRA